MRIGVVAVVFLLLLGSGRLNAQTPEIQDMVDDCLRTLRVQGALERLGQGTDITGSLQVLAVAAVEEPVRGLQRTGASLGRLLERFAPPARREAP